MPRAKRNPADAAMTVRVVEPVFFPDLSERRALKLASVHRYVARAHFGSWLARTGRPDFTRLVGIFTPLVHVEFAVTDLALDTTTKLRIAGQSRLARVLDGGGDLRHLAREGLWEVTTQDGRDVARARMVNVFTRYDTDPARRRVTELPAELGVGPLPSHVIEVPTLDDLVPRERAPDVREESTRAWHYAETDPNRHVNGMAYLRSLEDFLANALHAQGHDLSRLFEVRVRLVYRKPCFRGEAYRRFAWCRGEAPLVMTAAVLGTDAPEGARPAMAAELTFGLHDETGAEDAAPANGE
jgi:hypothetical protein